VIEHIPGVYSFELFTSDFCDMLVDEVVSINMYVYVCIFVYVYIAM